MRRFSMGKNNKNFYEFETIYHNKYIFDNCSGAIVPSSDKISYILSNFEQPNSIIIRGLISIFGMSEIDALSLYSYIQNLCKNGMFYSHASPYSDKIYKYEDILNILYSHLTLILTEDCNLRCKYCVYSDHYPGMKSYSSKNMSTKTALKAVDMYLRIHEERVKRGLNSSPAITFYGGEPFLKIDIIKDVVSYCKQKNLNVNFNVTTNGTILNDEIIEFLIQSRINIAFSLDGYKENHDRNRVFSNNQPSFDLVFNNIKKLQKRKKALGVETPIMFVVTYDLKVNIEKVFDFFNTNDSLFAPYSVTYNGVNDSWTDYYSKLNYNILKESIEKIHQIVFEKISKQDTNFITPAVKSFYKNIFSILTNSKFIDVDQKQLCLIGSKLAVAPDEKIYMCEKVTQSCSIGDLDNGISMKKINALSNKYLHILNHQCQNCNISRLCGMCYAHMIKDNDLYFPENTCENLARGIKNALCIYYSLLETSKESMEKYFEI